MSGTQNLPALSWTKLDYDNALIDTNTEFNTTNNRFVATNTGYYRVHAGYYENAATTLLNIAVYVNGTLYSENYVYGISSNIIATADCIVSLNATDFVEIFVYNPYGSVVTLDPTGIEHRFYFEIEQIR
ncbi:hypothetical protein ATE92_1356 [Ulvibacter sp. MAR_2010_11]|uniref:hypothetical protein n=1 Tax=Ulvibacter sp. MAR_2010_11 TaxID=1250229 RepID=UPI000C2BBE35|nr:hypothetical protein [Ulvibacter sp. MAR_2010_11]PKA83207.1 hypothetical protein ATE92_1356 [Ulvibacter sp. MAR_2010_11]